VPRPKLLRNILAPPSVDGFKPSKAGDAAEIVLSVEEFEAIRLVDFEGLDQAQAAVHMGVSRQTFGRVLRSARFILSSALVKGLQLRVTGGCYQVQGHGRGHGGGPGRHRHRRLAPRNTTEPTLPTGDDEMTEDQKTLQRQNTNNNQNSTPGTGQGKSSGQGRGNSSAGGRGKGCGRGRGQGGGKGDGSCRRS
jgi:predicted DNA-binding protein (UPF0251 family)